VILDRSTDRKKNGYAFALCASVECKEHLKRYPFYFKGRSLRTGDSEGQLSKKLRDAAVQKTEREALYCTQLQLCTHWPQQVSSLLHQTDHCCQPTSHFDATQLAASNSCALSLQAVCCVCIALLPAAQQQAENSYCALTLHLYDMHAVVQMTVLWATQSSVSVEISPSDRCVTVNWFGK
jgi:hypothetical protein